MALRITLLGNQPDPGLETALAAYPGGETSCALLPFGEIPGEGEADLVVGPVGMLPSGGLPQNAILPADLHACVAPRRASEPVTPIPLRLDPRLAYYRSDMLEERREQQAFRALNERELVVPEHWGQFVAAAHFFTRPPQLYGCVFAGTAAGLARFFAEAVLSLGGSLADWRGRPRVVGREAEAAAALLHDLHVRFKTTPPELPEMDEAAAAEWFRRGRAALAVEGPVGFRRTTDTSFSAVAGWLGLAAIPGTKPPRRATLPRVLGAAIPAGSADSEGALALLRHLVSDAGQEALAKDAGVPARRTVWEGLLETYRSGSLAQRRGWLLGQAVETAPRPLPLLREPKWTEAVGGALREMLAGALEPQAALKRAQAALDERPGTE